MVAAVLVSSVVALALLPGPAAVAEVVDPVGGTPCDGVVVVVDAAALDRAVAGAGTPDGLVACAGRDTLTGATPDGLEVLRAAGIAVEGTAQWGAAFVCRVEGRPAASEEIALPDGTVVREPCTRTPSTQAYWTLWTAAPGGAWTYAQTGVGDMELAPGSALGLAFAVGTDAPAAPGVPAHEARTGALPDGWARPTPDADDPDRASARGDTLPVLAVLLVATMGLAGVLVARRRR